MGPSIERISGAWAAQATYLTVLQASLKVTRRDATRRFSGYIIRVYTLGRITLCKCSILIGIYQDAFRSELPAMALNVKDFYLYGTHPTHQPRTCGRKPCAVCGVVRVCLFVEPPCCVCTTAVVHCQMGCAWCFNRLHVFYMPMACINTSLESFMWF